MIRILKKVIYVLMKLAGLTPQIVEVEPGTKLHFWVPTETINKTNGGQNEPIPPRKPVVVLIHGFAEDGAITWIPQVFALAGKYAVYVPDLLFFGGSISDKANWTIEFQAQCVARSLEKLGVEKCTLVGFSYGGFVSVKIAESKPELVQDLVLSGSIPPVDETTSRGLLERLGYESWSEVVLPTNVKEMKRSFVVVCHRRPPMPRLIYRQYLKTMFNNREQKAELLHAIAIKDSDHRRPKISQKVHFLAGEEDKIFRPEDIYNAIKRYSKPFTSSTYLDDRRIEDAQFSNGKSSLANFWWLFVGIVRIVRSILKLMSPT
ncbi:hypothetical protein K2173_013518 [Erythroxylum novogranatense]|uniref:AB hydrolase-1 domain-containing protein n=1 Tax=Erythroxylum novogranatense TaxID=1862640 RepID=A0AAV8TJR4_9ROSI|nr:hypothetical protein K2173_013518 [Erythroxylum novogranatense]